MAEGKNSWVAELGSALKGPTPCKKKSEKKPQNIFV